MLAGAAPASRLALAKATLMFSATMVHGQLLGHDGDGRRFNLATQGWHFKVK